jgi:transposase
MAHRNAPLSVEGRRRLITRCRHRPIAHVAAEMGISRQCASKWVHRYRQFGELGLHDRSSTPKRQPTATPAEVVTAIESMRRKHKYSAARIAFELDAQATTVSRRTVTRHLHHLGLNRRRFLDPTGASNRAPRRIVAHRPGHMVHLDVKKVGRIPDGGGWPVHGRGSSQAKAAGRAKTAGARAGYVYWVWP